MLHRRGVPVQAERGVSLREEGETEASRGRNQLTVYLHPKPAHRICVRVTAKLAVVHFMQVDGRLLSDPGGGAVGGAWSPDGEEFINQVAPPEKTTFFKTCANMS